MKVLLKIKFVGTAYSGYQVQGDTPTVQRALNEAARALFCYDCDIVGCSRTDAGVHAEMFCAAVSKRGQPDLTTDLSSARIVRAMSSHLPGDIAVTDACFIPDDFHPRYGVAQKEYRYRFRFSPIRDPFDENRVWSIPAPILPDALERMNRAASAWIGTHDFTSYMAQGSKIADATRTVFAANVERDGSLYTFRVRADGFLYNMVRIMAGTLADVALGKREPDTVPKITEGKDRSLAGATAPAHALYLCKVIYNRPDILPETWEN